MSGQDTRPRHVQPPPRGAARRRERRAATCRWRTSGPARRPFVIIDSMLSENACLGFEFGFSMADPSKLVVWEAQFGDFANGAQVIIDQFIASSESKWQRMSGLVLLLPHGYEGQGPEHSSARLERFLQLCAEDNMQVCNFTTPGAVLPRAAPPDASHVPQAAHRDEPEEPAAAQARRLHRSRDLSRRDASSPCSTTSRSPVRPRRRSTLDPAARAPRAAVQRQALLRAARRAGASAARTPSAIVRVEQLYPVPATGARAVLARYPQAEQVYWVQEEPANMGAWRFVEPLLRPLLGRPHARRYVGRDEAASPATRLVQGAPGGRGRAAESRLRTRLRRVGRGDGCSRCASRASASRSPRRRIARWAKARRRDRRARRRAARARERQGQHGAAGRARRRAAHREAGGRDGRRRATWSRASRRRQRARREGAAAAPPSRAPTAAAAPPPPRRRRRRRAAPPPRRPPRRRRRPGRSVRSARGAQPDRRARPRPDRDRGVGQGRAAHQGRRA